MRAGCAGAAARADVTSAALQSADESNTSETAVNRTRLLPMAGTLATIESLAIADAGRCPGACCVASPPRSAARSRRKRRGERRDTRATSEMAATLDNMIK